MLAYTNDRGYELEQVAASFSRATNDDIHRLLTWAAALNGEIDRLHKVIKTVVEDAELVGGGHLVGVRAMDSLREAVIEL